MTLGVALVMGVVAGRALVGSHGARFELADYERLAGLGQSDVEPPQPRWPVRISVPDGPPRVPVDEFDALGRQVSVSCTSCHAHFEPNAARRSTEEPAMTFHQGLAYSHGELSCISCHNPQSYNTLRLAGGTGVELPDVMTMCSQCHAPQARDYERGAHGGMTGHWDLARGPQNRKSCIDCHDPHKPAFPTMTPAFKPIDRFLEPPRDH